MFEALSALSDGVLESVSSDESGLLWIAGYTHDREPGVYRLYDHATGESRELFRGHPHLDPADLAPMDAVSFTARDGLPLHGFLTLPVGTTRQDTERLPLVLVVHGGPWAHDAWGYDPEVQFLANRGYAVLQVNFRGSPGYGRRHLTAAIGELAGAMHDDLIDACDWAVGQGWADPDRIGIYGGSYGGYAALAGVTLQQGLYRCAVAVAPVSDIRAMYNEDYRESGDRRITKEALLQQLGPRDRWDDVSPRRNADRADAPILLIHGREDTVVPYSHSTQMADKLKDNGKPYELVSLDGEDHWLSLSATRQQMLEATMRFVQEHNPAD